MSLKLLNMSLHLVNKNWVCRWNESYWYNDFRRRRLFWNTSLGIYHKSLWKWKTEKKEGAKVMCVGRIQPVFAILGDGAKRLPSNSGGWNQQCKTGGSFLEIVEGSAAQLTPRFYPHKTCVDCTVQICKITQF